MEDEYDEKAEATYIRFNKGEVAESAEIDDDVIADYDRDGKVLGVEVLNLPKGKTLNRGQLLEKAMRSWPIKRREER